ncbi:PIG-P [Rhodocollybia butyracea]|uniref:PIG-P n=1 Tax=Rhodocollybia butyracea TaxID=206335 RepID=A0A9P5U762_9AGAR|nr:PIG-P [Rhodocollybia butyracea]
MSPTSSRASEFYGFVAWTLTYLLFIVYLLWGLLPDSYIVWLGVGWYPSREWSILIPAWSLVLVLLTYWTYFALTIRGTPGFGDAASLYSQSVEDFRVRRNGHANGKDEGDETEQLDELYDIPIEVVNRVLYTQ